MRSFVCRIVSLVLLASVAPVAAQTYPSRPITIVVGYPPGATSDLLARTVGEPLAAALGQPILIDNRAGAGGNVAAAYVARAPGDGYTLLVGTDAMMTSNIYLYKNVAFDPVNDVSPITNAGANIICLAVSSQLPVNSVAELIAYARANPGKLSFGSSGTASPHHLSGELLRQMAGIDILHVPYKGSTGARNDIIAGQVDMMFDSVPTMAPMIETGRVKPLGTSGRVRSSALPNVPTLAEAGIPGYEATIWLGVMAPAGTPQAIVDRLNTEIGKILARPDIAAAWRAQGANPMIMKPDAFGGYMQSEIERWAKVIKANGVKSD
jgi:tripartite-type tricarboxylate transporter receptor subunit TctC